MRKITDIRSPLWQVIALGIFYPLALLIIYRNETHTTDWPLSTLLGLSFVAVAYALFLGVRAENYNRKNPAHKINIFGLKPAELKEEDEGMRMITATATRQTYIYDSIAMAALAVSVVFFPYNAYLAVTGVTMVSLGHYLVYWRYIWRAL